MEQKVYKDQGFPITVESGQTIRVNAAAYADDLILFAESGAGIKNFLDVLAKFCNHKGMRINVKKCVALAELWEGDRAVKLDAPFVYRKFLGQDPLSHLEQWGDEEEIPTETSSLYLGTTIAFNKETKLSMGSTSLNQCKKTLRLSVDLA
jgi:hypothetical protein